MARSHDDGTSTYDSTTASTYDATALTYDATALTYDATASAYDCATTLTYDSATIADDAIAMGKQPDGLPIRPMFPHPYSPAPHHLALRRHPAPRHRKPDSTAQMLSQQGLKRSPQVHSAWPAHRHLAYDTSIAPAPSHHGRPYARQGGLVQPYGYTGRRYDAETDLWYFRARYFDAELGRFISRDPLNSGLPAGGYHDGLNLYGAYFAPNNLDPDGTDSVRTWHKNCQKLKSIKKRCECHCVYAGSTSRCEDTCEACAKKDDSDFNICVCSCVAAGTSKSRCERACREAETENRACPPRLNL